MEKFKERVVKEQEELNTKTEALKKFVVGRGFDSLDEQNQELLKDQLVAMISYNNALKKRLSIL